MTSDAIIVLKTHRYEFSEITLMQLNYFTQVHKYDNKKTFQAEWKKWIATCEMESMIEYEKERLMQNGFQGNIQDKMYKAIRYYFMKKPATGEKKAQRPRKPYVGLSGKLLTAMDTHIITKIKENMQKEDIEITENPTKPSKSSKSSKPSQKTQYKSNVSPDKSYNDFYNTNTEIIENETRLLLEQDITENHEIEKKIKKTYKNRYQTIRKKLQT